MDKGLIVKVAVVIMALLFLMEPLSTGIQNWGKGGELEETDMYVGTANVNLTIYSYGAFLYANSLTEFQKTQVLGNPEVLSVEPVEDGYYRITLRDSAKTRDAHNEFKELEIQCVAVAQVGLPDEYMLTLEDGSKLEVHGGYHQLVMEPVLEAGRKLSYVIAVESDGTNTYRILDAKNYHFNVELSGPGTIVAANSSAYLFTVPWEERNIDLEALEEQYGKENVVYDRRDYVVFSPPLTPAETVMLKKDYVTYISEGSASLDENFTNKSLAREDFMGRAIFQDSILQIQTSEELNLSYGYVKINTYVVSLPRDFDGYVLEAGEVVLPCETQFEVNDTATVVFNATVTGDMILGIMEIYLKE